MSVTEDERNPVVRYTAKELFDKIDKKLDTLLAKVDAAATKDDLHALEAKHDGLAERVVVIETTSATKRQSLGTALASAGATSALVGVLLALFH
jgi:hypothetical protein